MKVKYKLEVMTTKQIRARLQEKAATEWKLHPRNASEENTFDNSSWERTSHCSG